MDDPEDMEAINIMLDDVMSADNVDVCNTEFLPGSSPASPPISDLLSESQITGQMFASVVRKSIGPNGLTHKQFGDIFSQLMDRLYFKLRHFRPCVFSKLVFDVSVEESELLQIALTGMCNLRAADGEAGKSLPTPEFGKTCIKTSAQKSDFYQNSSAKRASPIFS